MQIRILILEVYKNLLLTNVGSPFPSHFHLPQIHGCCSVGHGHLPLLATDWIFWKHSENIGGTMFSDSSSMSSKVFFLGMFECQSFLGLKCGRDFCSNGNTWKLEIKLSRKHQQNKLRTTKDCETNHDHHGHREHVPWTNLPPRQTRCHYKCH